MTAIQYTVVSYIASPPRSHKKRIVTPPPTSTTTYLHVDAQSSASASGISIWSAPSRADYGRCPCRGGASSAQAARKAGAAGASDATRRGSGCASGASCCADSTAATTRRCRSVPRPCGAAARGRRGPGGGGDPCKLLYQWGASTPSSCAVKNCQIASFVVFVICQIPNKKGFRFIFFSRSFPSVCHPIIETSTKR